MTTFNTGAYPPGCTQRDVDMAQPGYWDDYYDRDEYDEPDWQDYDYETGMAEYEAMVRREERRERWRAFANALCFWRRWSKRPQADINDEVPF